jgi:hypothetical protein
MPHVRTRSFRTALLTTALTTAVAVPAAAAPPAPAAPAVTTISTKRARTVADRDFSYRRGAGRGENQAETAGRIAWSGSLTQNRGDAVDTGRGYTIVGFELLRPDRPPVRRFFVTMGSTETDFRVKGRFERVRVIVCKVAIPTVHCDNKVYGEKRPKGSKAGRRESGPGRDGGAKGEPGPGKPDPLEPLRKALRDLLPRPAPQPDVSR